MTDSWAQSLISYANYLEMEDSLNTKTKGLLQKSLRLSQANGLLESEVTGRYLLGIYALKRNDLDTASHYLLDAEQASEENSFAHLNEWIVNALVDLYKQTEDYSRLCTYLEKKQKILEQKHNNAQSWESQVSFEVKMRMRKEAEYEERKESYQRSIVLISVSSFLFLLVALIIFILYKNNRRKTLLLQETLYELEDTTDKKNTIYSIIAHDLKGPLGSVNEVLKIILNEEHDAVKNKKLMTAAQQSLTHTYTLLNNLLEWARLEQNQSEYNPEVLQLNELIEECLGVYVLPLKNKQLNIVKEYPKDISLKADRNMLLSIIANLLGNAIKYSHPGGDIDITTYENDQEVVLKITDYGTGMEASRLKSLMDDELAGTRNEKGTGLGLKITRMFITCHNGQLNISSSPGEGSIFEVYLPK